MEIVAKYRLDNVCACLSIIQYTSVTHWQWHCNFSVTENVINFISLTFKCCIIQLQIIAYYIVIHAHKMQVQVQTASFLPSVWISGSWPSHFIKKYTRPQTGARHINLWYLWIFWARAAVKSQVVCQCTGGNILSALQASSDSELQLKCKKLLMSAIRSFSPVTVVEGCQGVWMWC